MNFRSSIEALDAEAELRLADVDLSLPDPAAEKPALAALKAETPPGCCIGCDRPLPKRKTKTGTGPRLLCGDPDCLQVYRDVWYGDRTAKETAARREKYSGVDGRVARHQGDGHAG